MATEVAVRLSYPQNGQPLSTRSRIGSQAVIYRSTVPTPLIPLPSQGPQESVSRLEWIFLSEDSWSGPSAAQGADLRCNSC